MRFKEYWIKNLSTNTVERVRFSANDFTECGLQYAPQSGMPLLEAYQLINKWNLQQSVQVYVYALPEK